MARETELSNSLVCASLSNASPCSSGVIRMNWSRLYLHVVGGACVGGACVGGACEGSTNTLCTYHLEIWWALGGKSLETFISCCIPLGQSSPTSWTVSEVLSILSCCVNASSLSRCDLLLLVVVVVETCKDITNFHLTKLILSALWCCLNDPS